MKKFWLLILPLILLLFLFFSSCDDSGVASWPPSGQLVLNLYNFKTINPSLDGIYEAWVKIDTQGVPTFYSLGRFNISGGSVVDPNGNSMTFKFNGDTSRLNLSTSAFVTIEPPGDYDPFPSSRILISTQLAVTQDSITGTLTIGGSEALDSAGRKLIEGEHWPYIFDTPTDNSASCFRGIWFCDASGNSMLPAGLALNPNSAWTYEAWVADTSNPGNPIYYSLGRFKNPYGPDSDGPGICAGPNQPYSKPGQDWVLNSCPPGKPTITDLKSGIYQVYITLEPQDEMPGSNAYLTPSVIRLRKQNYIISSAPCRVPSWMTFVYTIEPYPRAYIKITYHIYGRLDKL